MPVRFDEPDAPPPIPETRTELACLTRALAMYLQDSTETEAIEQSFGVKKGSGQDYQRARALFKHAIATLEHRRSRNRPSTSANTSIETGMSTGTDTSAEGEA